ncbi:MAG TPA: type II toxin-antitoxin system RelE/ParE family toxin [Acidobacteriaceae bacterium]|nr:type II toxin-antitoxin system RelE/ParE family toxin [Acidobacteriaceae bacterium]
MAPSAENFTAYATKPFSRLARKARIDDEQLWLAATDANEGRIDADLGGGVVKQRIARTGQGKSGGSRSILLLRRGRRAVFVYGFEKKDQANIAPGDLELFRELAPIYLDASEAQMIRWMETGAVRRIQGSYQQE